MCATAACFVEWSTEVGTLVALEPELAEVASHSEELAAGYNAPENARLMGHLEHFSGNDVVGHYTSMLAEGAHLFLLYLDGKLVGDADLRGMRDGAAEFAFMIAARDQQGKGLGTKFALMVHAFAFATLGLRRVYVSILPENRASRRVFDKLGYTVDEGTEARAFAEDIRDVTMGIDRATFEHAHAEPLGQLRIAPRVDSLGRPGRARD